MLIVCVSSDEFAFKVRLVLVKLPTKVSVKLAAS